MIRSGLLLLFVMSLAFGNPLKGQSFNFGIRAGLAQSKFTGPVEEGVLEEFGFSGGFHFGINFQVNITEVLGWRTEVMYTQMGSSYRMKADNGYYIFNDVRNNIQNLVFRSESEVNLDHSNAYVQFPQTLNLRLTKKIELLGGAYIGFLISPVATGTFSFGGGDLDLEHSFVQGLDFNYYTDPPRLTIPDRILIRVDGADVDLLRTVDSRTFWQNNIEQSRFKSIDYGLIVGASYYLNRGLYLMGRMEYGMSDVTRNSADYSFSTLGENGALIFNNDIDRNLSFQLSLGFKF